MEITFLGHSSFKIRGKDVTVVTDPFDSKMVGLTFPKSEADIVTVSHQHPDHSASIQIGGEPFVIDSPGEYEIKGCMIFGIPSFHDMVGGEEKGKNIIYAIEVEGVRICHLGDLGHKLSDKQLEELSNIDVLLVPVGGTATIGPEEAASVISQLEPRIVIPMHYQMPGINLEVFGQLKTLAEFLKTIGEEEIVPVPKLVLSRDKLPEERQTIVLEKKG